MAYFFVEDAMPENPKIEEVGDVGGWLHLSAIAYCNRTLSDGLIRQRVAWRLTQSSDKELCAALVGVHLWHDSESRCERCPPTPMDHYQIHDYLDHQKSRSHIEELREKYRGWGRKGAETRWGSRDRGAIADPIADPIDIADPIAQAIADPVADLVARPSVRPSERKDIAVDEKRSSEIEVLPQGILANGPLKAPRSDPLWDALVAVCGIDSSKVTTSERGRCNKALKDLRDVSATPDEIVAKAIVYRTRYTTPLTPNALTSNWASLEGVAGQRPVDPHELELQQWIREDQS